MSPDQPSPWYENPVAVGALLALMVVLILLVWLVGVGAVLVAPAG